MTQLVFITGFLRSGTTLLEKILHNHPDVCIGPQPSPFLFYKAKETFYRERGINCQGYPLGPLFRELSYDLEDFTRFLNEHVFTREDVIAAFKEMEGYSGQLTPELQVYRERVGEGTLYEIFRRLTGFICEIFGKEGAHYGGVKEVFCEEFTSFFLGHKSKVIILIRDPRDVLTSVRFGKGEKYAGKGLPTLYVLRNWRKSVAFALAYKDDPNFLSIRYEDIVQEPRTVLDRVTVFLGLNAFAEGQFKDSILDQRGNMWRSNSSFEPSSIINRNSIGRYRGMLSPETIRYVESVCYPEMLASEYGMCECRDGADEGSIRDFREPFETGNDKIPGDYSTLAENIEQEIQRLNLLRGRPGAEEKNAWFIFESVYDELTATLNGVRYA